MRSMLSQEPDQWDAAVERHTRRLKELGSAEAYVAALAEAGWTEGWSDEHLRALSERVAEAWDRTPRHLYVYSALADVSFDVEGFVGGDGAYAQLLEKLAKASRGALEPSQATEEAGEPDAEGAREVTISIATGGEPRTATFTQADDWCANEPFELIEGALDATDCAARFVVLPNPGDQTLCAAFVRPEAFEAALGDHLLPDAAVVL